MLLHWGGLASVVGAILTIFFSRSAARAAGAARIASDQTRQKLQSIDLLSELNRLIGRVDDLMIRLETSSWVVVAERATDLRISVAAIIAPQDVLFTDEIVQRMAESISQFKNIAAGADRAMRPDSKNPDVARYRKIASDQKETLVLAMQEVKIHMGESR